MTVQNATFLAIFLHFARKIVDKVKIEENGDIPLYVDKGCGEYNVMVKDAGVYWTCNKHNARMVAAAIIETCPHLRGDTFIIESEDVECDIDQLLPYVDGGDWYRIRRVIRDLD